MLVSSFLKVSVCSVGLFVFNSYGLGDIVSWEANVWLPMMISEIPNTVPQSDSLQGELPIIPIDIDAEKEVLFVEMPTKTPVVTDDGRFVVSSVESYSVGKTDNRTSCSFIARNNLQELLTAMGIINTSGLPRWDAKDLIQKGIFWKTVQAFENPENIFEVLDTRNRDFFETVFDAYRYVPTRSPEIQFHRVAFFRGDDDIWYILDPADGKMTTQPQDLRTYISESPQNAQWFLRTQWYSKLNIISSDIFQRLMAYLSPALHGFYQEQYLEVPRRLRVVEFS